MIISSSNEFKMQVLDYMGHMAVQRLALPAHSKKVLSLNLIWSLSVWFLSCKNPLWIPLKV